MAFYVILCLLITHTLLFVPLPFMSMGDVNPFFFLGQAQFKNREGDPLVVIYDETVFIVGVGR